MTHQSISLEKEIESIEMRSPELRNKIMVGLSEENISRLVQYINGGKVAIFYCGTSYAMGANAFNYEGIKRMYEIKGRDANKPLSILVSRLDYEKYVEICDRIKSYIDTIVQKYWPGPISIILPKRKRDNENEYVIPSEVTAGEHSVHIVCIDDITEYMAVLSDSPIAVTSANMSGSKLITNPLDVIYKFEKQVDKFLIGEKKQYKFSTTIVDFSKEIPRIARNTSYRIVKELQSIIPGLETCSRKNSHNNYN